MGMQLRKSLCCAHGMAIQSDLDSDDMKISHSYVTLFVMVNVSITNLSTNSATLLNLHYNSSSTKPLKVTFKFSEEAF